MGFLGDELAAKDLIDNALAADEFKWVSLSHERVDILLNSIRY